MSIAPRFVHIKTQDDFPIAAHIFNPKDFGIKVKSSCVISNATGVQAKFYHKFATWLCEQGVGVITYDYRYSGLSFPKEFLTPIQKAASMKDEDLELETYRLALKSAPDSIELSSTWSQLDLAAITIFASFLWREVDLTLIGNSLGGHLITLLDINTILGTDFVDSLPASSLTDPQDTYSSSSRPQRVTRIINVCGGNAHWKNNNNPEAARFAFKEMIQKPLKEDGIFYSTNLGLGWDLPGSCGEEWLEWFFSPLFSLTRKHNARNAREVTQACPLLYVGFEDDDTITKLMMEQHLSLLCHPNSNVSSLWINPSERKPVWPRCGHVNSFSPSGIQEIEINDEFIDDDNDGCLKETAVKDKGKGKAALRGGELYEPSSFNSSSSKGGNEDQNQNQKGSSKLSEDKIPNLKREETIWQVYLNFILNGEIQKVGEIKEWGSKERRNHETLFRIYEKEKKEEEERGKYGNGDDDDENEDDEDAVDGNRKSKL